MGQMGAWSRYGLKVAGGDGGVVVGAAKDGLGGVAAFAVQHTWTGGPSGSDSRALPAENQRWRAAAAVTATVGQVGATLRCRT